MAPERLSPRRYRCRFCGRVLPAWLPVPGEPNGAMLLSHLSQHHREQVGAYLARMHTDDDITPVAAKEEIHWRKEKNLTDITQCDIGPPRRADITMKGRCPWKLHCSIKSCN